MDRFRERLREARSKNVDGYFYLSRLAVDRITDSDTISQIISQKYLLGDETDPMLANAPLDSLKEKVLKEAKVTFAISCYAVPHCLRYMARLIIFANARGSQVDHRLPFSKQELCSCGFHEDHADKFFSTQWQFVAPKIRLGALVPTEFDPEVILPLRIPQIEHKPPPDTGAFGTVTEVCLEESHQVEPVYVGRIVRKTFHQEIPKDSFLRELRNLCILSSARHDNIIQLLAAYTQHNSFNLIFPHASHGNLDQLFHSDSPMSWPVMASENSIVMALSGLASALATMHEFTTENIHMIGCHRDLKPANILVDDKRFLLADFGLSRIVDNQGTSSSTAPNVVGDFIAPEHEDRDFTRNPIGRSSDIWAFGCVTFMLLAFLDEGRQGLDKLENKRRVEWHNYAHHCFHDYDRPNLGLQDLIQRLDSSQSASIQGLLHLVKKILVLEKNFRPKATAVDAYISYLILYTWSSSIVEAFGEACKSDYIHVHFERARFRGWRSAVKVDESDFPAFQQGSTNPRFGSFKVAVEHLQELQGLLKDFIADPVRQGRKAFLPVKNRIDRLLQALDEETQTAARAHTDFVMLGSKKLSWLRELQQLFEKSLDKRTESKVATRMLIVRPSSSKELHVDFASLKPHPEITGLSIVRILSNGDSKPDFVLAEEAHIPGRYKNSQGSTYNYQRTPSRLQEVANLLARSGHSSDFNVLTCRGYYHNLAKLRSGLLYELPSGPLGKDDGILTLREILNSGAIMWCLGDRFQLARSLATAIYELHSIAWLHRNVTASNVAFFYKSTRENIDPKSFYFVGFAQSRADRDLTDSDGALSGVYDEEYYQHPDYLSKSQGYQMHHDYHALGMLLLEVGLWKLFPNAVGDRPVDLPSDFAMNELVPQLDGMTGRCYRNAVEACLDGRLSDASLAQQGQKVPLRFLAKVVDQLSLSHCRA